MKRPFFCFICILLSGNIFSDEDLLNDYKLLYVDLLNIGTYGYKSYFNSEINRSSENINLNQGSLLFTNNTFDCSIVGTGFFKIRLENDLPGYTRDGNFLINSDGLLVTHQGYPLFDPVYIDVTYIFDNIKIWKDGSISYNSLSDGEVKIGKILTYKIPGELLEQYDKSIYIIKKDLEYEEEIMFDNQIIQGTLEMSNFELGKVVIRMYYILTILDENIIPNIDFKKELLRLQIEKMAETSALTDIVGYIEIILPFIKYDY